MSRFARFAALTLAFNLAVILWGAYVRASGSGAGCGSHWPLCNGEVIPRAAAVQTLVELTHRATSGIALLLVATMVVWAFRAFPRRHPARLAAAGAGLFIVTEALVGAGLVLFELVAHNASIARAWWMAAHLTNSFLLLATLTLTWRWGAPPARPRLYLRGQGAAARLLLGGGMLLLALGATGAVTALGDTLELSAPEVDGVRQGLSPAADFLVSLRVYHPFFAVAVGAYVAAAAFVLSRLRPAEETRSWAAALAVLFVTQLGMGVVNVVSRAPIPVQLVHLALADAVWMSFVLLAASVLAQNPLAAAAPATVEQLAQRESQPV